MDPVALSSDLSGLYVGHADHVGLFVDHVGLFGHVDLSEGHVDLLGHVAVPLGHVQGHGGQCPWGMVVECVGRLLRRA